MSKTYVVDCATGEAVLRDMTTDEEARLSLDCAEATDRVETETAAGVQRENDLALLTAEAQRDPKFAALLRLLRP